MEQQDTLVKMADKMAALEQALKQIADAKKQLCRNTTEAKSRIQCNISRQLEALRNREVWLLNQLDVVSSAKEEVLQQQSARLNKTLGVIQSSIQFPGNTADNTMTRNLARLDLGELQPEETPYVSFKSNPGSLREAITSYGRIDHTSVPPLHSPFMNQDQLAPSLPKHFEDYNDAEHHVLYKTVEEINRSKTNEPCVNVSIPKLSNRLEDWLLYPSSTSHTTGPMFTFPRLSNNLSDWLKVPVTSSRQVPMKMSSSSRHEAEGMESLPSDVQNYGRTMGPGACGQMEGFDDMSADASIKTWLHKIKQNPYDEEEDYDFVEEMSETRTQCSVDSLAAAEDEAGLDVWLSTPQTNKSGSEDSTWKFKVQPLPQSKWLQEDTATSDKMDTSTPMLIDMSRYLSSITEELDQWLLNDTSNHEETDEDRVDERLRPEVPSSLTLNSWLLSSSQGSRSDNPWLQKSRSFMQSSKSSVSSGASSFSTISSSQFSCNTGNKWLLHGGKSQVTATTVIPCSFMDRYKTEMEKLNWVKCDQSNKAPSSSNPLASFIRQDVEATQWLKPSSTVNYGLASDATSPLKNYYDLQQASSNANWLQSSHKSVESEKKMIAASFNTAFDKDDRAWLIRAPSPFLAENMQEVEV